MKKIFLFAASFVLLLGTCALAALELPRHNWEVGAEFSHVTYKESGVMKEKGLFYGVTGAYAYHQNLMLKAESRLA